MGDDETMITHPASLKGCPHIDIVHLLVTNTRGLRGHAAEIGAATGRTALPLLAKFEMVYIIDLWPHNNDDMRQCLEMAATYRDKAVILRGLSWEMAQYIPDESLDYFWLDCDHAYESVKKDLHAYYPKLRSGIGAIASGHDYTEWHPGVPQAVNEFVAVYGIPYLHTQLGCSDAWAFEKP
jgi:hypothetical protein